MLLRMSSLFLRTLREDPADAEVPSHKLLVRAGYVRRVAPGIYSWLPLGKIVLDNITRVVREEMNRIGGQEVLFPALLPREYYETSGRWADYGDLLFRLRDRKGGDYLLGPTHEELFTDLVKGEYSSYKDYPAILYQIQTKYRDEARPRAGVLRGREFVMKDSYSFDLDDAGLKAAYELHREAYVRMYTRLGLEFRTVFATSGAMGGSASEEFLAPAPTGEDTFVQCTNCDYAANTEAVELAVPPAQDPASHAGLVELDTPSTPTIETLVESVRSQGYDVDASGTLKNVVLKTRRPGEDWELLVIGVPGDREVSLDRLAGQFEPTEVAQADAEDLEAQPALVRGYIGPQILREAKVRYLVDPSVVPGSSWITGANKEDRHAANVVRGRDFEPDGEIGAIEVREGDRCARCGAPLTISRGIEIGHIFQLGRKYADLAELDALGPDGKPVRITMGSYGVGVSRAVAAIVEQRHDDNGIIWPREVAPADVHIVAAGKSDEQIEVALRIGGELEARGLRAIVDDRKGVSPGVKFNDSELVGVPTIVVVGRGLANGVVELKDRASGERADVPLAEIVDRVAALVAV